jgi:hypothetical protein
MYHEDIKSDIQTEFLQQMVEIDLDGPFAKDSPEAAAAFLLEKGNFLIHNLARSLGRKEADKRKKQSGQAKKADERKKQSGQADNLAEICWPKKRSRQADDLANVRQPDLPPAVETQLFAIATSLPRITSGIPGFTPRDNDITRKEVLRQVGIDDLPAPIFDQVAQAAGISSFELHAYNEYHEEHGQNSESDRQAWSRARAKVVKALTRAALTSLLSIIFALPVMLLDATHQGRSGHQNDLVRQGNLANEIARDHQTKLGDVIARDHQNKLGDEVARDHQSKLGDVIARDHQTKLGDEVACDHQSKLGDEIARDHQTKLIQKSVNA